jgi:CBS domain-containing protein
VRRLPVVSDDGKLVGILAQADVARRSEVESTGKVVRSISE